MPARRLLMRKIREVLRLKHEQGLSHQAVAQACAVGVGTVNRYLQRAAQRGLGWPLRADLDDAALEARLFPRAAPVHDRIRPDCAYIHRELKRDSVTLQLLWEDAQIHPDGYGRTQFCEFYRQWTRRLRPSMRQVHRAGEKTFIDYSGKRPSLVDRRTGELRRVELFVAVLGASVAQIIERRPHPEQGYRACLGIMRLGQQYGNDRLDAASARAMALGSYRYRTVKNILAAGQDRLPLEPAAETTPTPTHTNIRGADYYAAATTEEEDRC